MILGTVLKLFLAMAVGYYLNKKGIFTAEVNQRISFFVINIAYPLMILTSMNSAKGTDKMEIASYILAGALVYVAMPLVSEVLVRVIFTPKEERPIYKTFFVFGNVLFMGFPVAAVLYGEGCMFYLSMFNLLFHLAYFTYGMRQIRCGLPSDGRKHHFTLFINNGTIASLLAVVMFFFNIYFPEPIVDALSFVGDLASPISMVVIGATIGTFSLKSVFTENPRLYAVAFIRLLIIPAVIYFVLTALGFEDYLVGCATVALGMPVASMISMGCLEKKNFEKIGPAAVVLTTILSLATIPCMLAFLG